MHQSILPLDGGARLAHLAGTTIEINDHDVIVGGYEELFCPNPRKGWRGCHAASIRIAPLPRGGWTWATSFYFSCGGEGSPLDATGKWEHEPTREDALREARMYLAERIERYLQRHNHGPDTRAAVKWLAELADDGVHA